MKRKLIYVLSTLILLALVTIAPLAAVGETPPPR
jgi:hypothetical protein